MLLGERWRETGEELFTGKVWEMVSEDFAPRVRLKAGESLEKLGPIHLVVREEAAPVF
jgi:hypothetical protein